VTDNFYWWVFGGCLGIIAGIYLWSATMGRRSYRRYLEARRGFVDMTTLNGGDEVPPSPPPPPLRRLFNSGHCLCICWRWGHGCCTGKAEGVVPMQVGDKVYEVPICEACGRDLSRRRAAPLN